MLSLSSTVLLVSISMSPASQGLSKCALLFWWFLWFWVLLEFVSKVFLFLPKVF